MGKKRVVIVGAYLQGIYPRGDNSVVADLLAPAFLKAFADADPEICEKYEIKILNLPTSLNAEELTSMILSEQPDVIGYSIYIWNYALMHKSTEIARRMNPDLRIIWGGPQVSYNSVEMMKANPDVDLIVCGSGETRFRLLLKGGLKTEAFSEVVGITYRDKSGNIIKNKGIIHEDLSKVPSPYQTNVIDLDDDKSHCVFIETSRGCIFRCGYCMWKGDVQRGLNHFSIDQVLKDIEIIYNRPNVASVVFTDACIFYNPTRAKLIMKKILSCKNRIPTIFTLDIAFLNEELIELLSKLQLSHQQFLFGMQSINELTLNLMNRRCNLEVFTKKVALLRKINPAAEITFDLIYGLPGDDFESFKRTVEFALGLSPIKLNCSPLMLLPGSPYWERKEEHGFVFKNNPPYAVHSNKYYSAEDMKRTHQLVLKIMVVMYFPAIRDIIYKISEKNPKYQRVELIQKLIEIFESKSNISIDVTVLNEQNEYFIKAYNTIKKSIMDKVAEPKNCLYMYEAMRELLRNINLEELAEDVLLGIKYYRTLYSEDLKRVGKACFEEYGGERINRVKFGWVVSANV
ncbi:MAG: hypothetical protein A2W17_07960 [Planctomycetes bacterium RBG_16_41_13]|nr:MAG: hypothetical protein A2W17_07960 [Planctomycetes bacterium RBG_16_41_13]